MIKMRYIVLVTIIIICFSNCAKRGYITGGDIDTIPPVALSFQPKNSSTNFNQKEFKITFDEYIKLKNINQNLIISPPMENIPDVTPMGSASKVLTVKIKDTLSPNTTYSFNFGESITDNNEGNVFPQFKYIFSTGDYIDSLTVSGTIKSANQLKPDNFVNIMLYDAKTFTDSTVYKQKPLYITNTLDSLTTFKIENIKEGSYYILALKDKNNNYKFDPAQDKIGFIKDSIQIPTDESYDLTLFKSQEKFKATRPAQVSQNKWYLPYQGGADSVNITVKNGEELIKSTFTYLPAKDSLQVWFPKIELDSLSVLVSKKDYSETFTVRPRPNMKTVDTLSISAVQSNTLDLKDTFKLISKTPISEINSNNIFITDKDSSKIPFEYINDFKEQKIQLVFQKKEADRYTIELLPGALIDFFGKENDSIKFEVKTKEKTDYGNLNVHLNGVKRFPIILQILDSKEEVVSEVYSEKETSILFDLLPPKLYYLRIIYDDNKNRKWDSGYYFDRRQPEETIYHPEQIDVRANWDIEQTIQL
ncbi:Ig-like domain-containing protein [Myroides guanonis]|uniref:Ig-like domain-containing protein n=1 Tax=Myroides guanonis TaxID=1150112 RepID=A0A1I3SK92_9FLAO|nr:Ig-like domain-containing protein [Myroides guanonis]SFJ58582.1 Ig-like domain-containing protein [Myroides guanonis]